VTRDVSTGKAFFLKALADGPSALAKARTPVKSVRDADTLTGDRQAADGNSTPPKTFSGELDPEAAQSQQVASEIKADRLACKLHLQRSGCRD
jgi:hypothetical protein